MKVLRPVNVTPAMLLASDLSEPSSGESAWSSGTTYALNDEVIVASTHRKYRSVQGSNTNHNPTTDDGTWWIDIGGSNKYAAFDEYLATASVKASSTSFAITIAPGVIDSLFLYGFVGEEATVVMLDGGVGDPVYSKTLDLLTPPVNDWWMYFFGEYRQVPYFCLTDVPPYANGQITITVTAASAADLAMGMVLPGASYRLGGTEYGVQAGIKDYSKKVIDENTGYATLVQGNFAKRLRAQLRQSHLDFAHSQYILQQLRAVPTVWIGDDTALIEPLVVYGFFKDYYLTIDHPTSGLYTLEIEGMT